MNIIDRMNLIDNCCVIEVGQVSLMFEFIIYFILHPEFKEVRLAMQLTRVHFIYISSLQITTNTRALERKESYSQIYTFISFPVRSWLNASAETMD